MSIIGNDGIKYSFESNDLIEELEQDIAEFGRDMEMFAIFKWFSINLLHGVLKCV